MSVTLVADAEEHFDAASPFDLQPVRHAFGPEIRRIAVENVNVGRIDIDMGEEVVNET